MVLCPPSIHCIGRIRPESSSHESVGRSAHRVLLTVEGPGREACSSVEDSAFSRRVSLWLRLVTISRTLHVQLVLGRLGALVGDRVLPRSVAGPCRWNGRALLYTSSVVGIFEESMDLSFDLSRLEKLNLNS